MLQSPVIIITGPTACGKSALALVLAEAFAGTIINADSMQIYCDLAILTARPSTSDIERAPHKLYGILDTTTTYSVAKWLELSLAEIESVLLKGELPIIVGGSGLYINALQHGIASVPEVPVLLRQQARILMEAIGPTAFHEELAKRDPIMASRIQPSDTQRLQRAWEVMASTGRSLAEWLNPVELVKKRAVNEHFCFCSLLLLPERSLLKTACDIRFKHMLEAGVLTEVESFLAKKLLPTHPLSKAIGLSVLTDYIHGYLTLEQAITLTQHATYHYAKRQYTWFRHHKLENMYVIHDRYTAGHPLTTKILSFVRCFLLTDH